MMVNVPMAAIALVSILNLRVWRSRKWLFAFYGGMIIAVSVGQFSSPILFFLAMIICGITGGMAAGFLGVMSGLLCAITFWIGMTTGGWDYAFFIFLVAALSFMIRETVALALPQKRRRTVNDFE